METDMRGSLPNAARTSSATGEHSRASSGWFSIFANKIAAWSGKPAAFLGALCLVIVWGVTGPIFHYSDTWQLVINTSTTIVTFLMVFLIQNTQNRDTLALQVKLAELIIAFQKADSQLALIEEASDDELQKIHEDLKIKAETAANSESKEHPEAQNA